MACRGCGGGGSPRRGVPQTITIADANPYAFVAVEYQGSSLGNRTFKVNGSSYVMNAGTNKVIPVRETDVAALSLRTSVRVLGTWGDASPTVTTAAKAKEPAAPPEPYDFTVINGIGAKLAEKLPEAGIRTLTEFVMAEPERLAEITGRSAEQAAGWQAEAAQGLS